MVDEFNPKSAVAIKEYQEVLWDSLCPAWPSSTATMPSSRQPSQGLRKLDCPSLRPSLLEDVRSKINSIPGSTGIMLQTKMSSVLAKNPSLETMQMVGKTLKGSKEAVLPAELSSGEVAAMKNCPVVSMDMEHSFSVYKNILSYCRHSLTNENLSKI